MRIIADHKAQDWSQPHLAPVVPISAARAKLQSTRGFFVELAILSALSLASIAATHFAAHALTGRPLGADQCRVMKAE